MARKKTVKGMSCDCWDSSKKDVWPESPPTTQGWAFQILWIFSPQLAEDIIIYHPIWEFNGLKISSDNLKQDASNLFQFIPFHSAGYLVKNIEHVSAHVFFCMPGVVGWSKDPSFSKVSLLSNSSSDETLKQSHEKGILTHLTHFTWYITGSDKSNTNQFLGLEPSKLQVSKQQL